MAFIVYKEHISEIIIVMYRKKAWKGTNILENEDLNSIEANLLNKTIQKIGLRNVWTENGNIFAILDTNKTIIRNMDDLFCIVSIDDDASKFPLGSSK